MTIRRRRSPTACSADACVAWDERMLPVSWSVCCVRRWRWTRRSARLRPRSLARVFNGFRKRLATRARRWRSRRSALKPPSPSLSIRRRACVARRSSTRMRRGCALPPTHLREGLVPAASRQWRTRGRSIALGMWTRSRLVVSSRDPRRLRRLSRRWRACCWRCWPR